MNKELIAELANRLLNGTGGNALVREGYDLELVKSAVELAEYIGYEEA